MNSPLRCAAAGSRRSLSLAALLVAALALPMAQAQTRAPDAAAPAASAASPPAETAVTAEPSYVIPALEIIGFDFLLNRYNRRFSGVSDYDVTSASIRRNLRGPWVVDNDPFRINQFAHPYQGSLYHGAARSTGLSYWEAAAYTFAGSIWWEITGEKTPPSRNDQVASGIAGSFLGEPLFRMAHLVLKDRSGMPQVWREVGAAAVSPAVGFNRLAFGSRFDGAFADRDPAYDGRLKIGGTHATRNDVQTTASFRPSNVELDFALDYGLPGKSGYTVSRPFDQFSFRGVLSSANGVENLATRGLLFGTDYRVGDDYRGVWGLYGSYDYVAPQLFNVSTTALSLGTTGQWWLSRTVALRGHVLAGIGYSAVSTRGGDDAREQNYHYGVAPRIGLGLRLLSDDDFSAELSAQRYHMGRIAKRAAGRDEITRADLAFTWRVTGRHGVGVKYVWTHRDASYANAPDRSQTVGAVGLYYTLLGEDGFTKVDWRGEPRSR